MAASNVRSSSSFSRNISVVSSPQIPGLKSGPNGTAFISTGIRDLDRILGGGYPLGSLVMVMEDPEAPHHMDLLRTFMSQGLVNNQPLLYASPSKVPRGFLGTLPHPASSKEDKSTAPDPDQRVKVYHLNEDGKWDDRGTGHVSIDFVERSEELSLCVIDEEDNETLLVHPINPEDIYRKQEDTIISWRDPERSTELALSFQETAGCSYVWDQICTMQRNLHFSSLNSETFHSLNSELRELPAVELTTLPLILKIVTESGITDQMRLTELILKDHDFFRNLMGVFKICEDLENVDGLHMIFNIVKGIILLNSSQILEKIFGDELIMEIIGCLEYDPGVPHSQHHRNFLKEHVVFKEAIPIKDPLVLSKIHQTYRIGYLKDVVLARVLDDAIVANLNSVIHANNAIVVSLLKDDSTFIQELFARLRSPSTSVESKKNLVYFLHEFCSLSKSLQVMQQLRLFRDLINEGIFHVIEEVLQIPDKKLVLTGTDILILFLTQDPNLLRSYVVRTEGNPLLGLLRPYLYLRKQT